MYIESPAFEYHRPIPKKYTCQGENISPPLQFGEIPKEAKTLVLIIDDPDAPKGTMDHWIVWNLDPHQTELSEKAQVSSQGRNGYGEINYRGPCPPPGQPHRYFFKLYALDTTLSLKSGSSKSEVEQAMQGHILDSAELVGTYQR